MSDSARVAEGNRLTDNQQPSTECPSCGRFVGAYARCPYCGADVGQRMVVRVFKYGSLVLAILGLAVLLFAAIGSDVPTIEIGDLQATMNWAYVRVEGVVTRQPGYDPKTGALRLWIDDGTGEIMVSAYRSEADELLAEGLLPVMGDRVALEGTLRIREDFQYLVLNVPQHTVIQRTEPMEMALAQVDTAPLYQKVRVRGVIRDERTPYEGLHIFRVRDETGEIDITIQVGEASVAGELPDLGIGQSVQVVGAIDAYNGTPQISVGRASDLVVLGEAVMIAASRPIGAVSGEDVGSMAAVEGTIHEVIPFSAGVKYRLDDGSGTLTLLLWQDLYDQVPERDALAVGTLIRVQGEIMEYRGELEIVPETPTDLEIMGMVAVVEASATSTVEVPSSTPEKAPTATPDVAPGETSEAITETPTDDGLGAATPSRTATATPEPTWTPIPSPEPVPTTAPTPTFTPTPAPETRTLGTISAGDVGRRFTIAQAGIADVSYFSAGIKYTLTDGTGSIILLLWQNVLEAVPDRRDLYPGSRVRVVGEIEEYGGDLEVIPEVGADVEVLVAGDRPPLEVRAVGEVTPSDEGRLFAVDGVVSRMEVHDWLYVWIDDGTGEILVYVPERVVEFLPAGVGPGVRLRVTGEVDIYRGVLEIIPQAGADVEVQ